MVRHGAGGTPPQARERARVQLPFLKAFWALEQRKSRIQDRLANQGDSV